MGRRSAASRKDTSTERSVRLRALLSAGMVLGLGAVGTLAAWTDESKATATFSAGTLDLKLKELPGGTYADSATITSLNMTDMYPGVSKAAMLQVSNSGTVPLSYTLTGSAMAGLVGQGGDLGGALLVGVYSGGSASNNSATTGSCTGTRIGTADVPLNTSLIATARALAPAGTEDLCLLVSLPLNAATNLQGTSTTATFTFNASMGS
ncbi:putative ribosomally synthesized peptide with SipW-like signal peptide [Pseudarthrobacter siccitolerans]|uniref:Ribosomally synthesized peptide with SipW-like signal peptide n=1 Tax=Pseudarthrobacter siccitolerans TaxID=861266 RepID=A0ABU0PIB7_9MICC|nr:TasA family protein [Pseudarthrobacter siccitolerans]MDQ0673705.1 putative ribosomally synthesized peptide with SipW-like signal peptide [Pseudarthrobacter siccitolerans]